MRYIVPNDDKVRTIPLGRCGENDYTEIAFDISEWQNKYDIESLVLVMRRAQDEEDADYPAVVTIDGNYAVHTLTSTDLRDVGNGKCQLVMKSGTVIAKTKVYNTVCLYSMADSGDTPAEWEPWMTEFARLVGDAETAAEKSEGFADFALESANTAESAKDEAIEARDSAIEAAENARGEVTEAFGEITASATTLEAGQSATASFNPSSKVMSFGIPRGEKGNEGAHGVPGAVVSNTEPTDPDIAVWVKPNGTVEPFDYEELKNLPKINYIPIKGNVTLWQLGVTKRGYLFTPSGEQPVTTKILSVTDNGVKTNYNLFCVDDEVD